MIAAHVFPLDPFGAVDTILLPGEPAIVASAVERELVAPNVRFLDANPRTPGILDSGCSYGWDPTEAWYTIPWCIRVKKIDCEDISGWGVAEDRVRRGIASCAAVYRAKWGLHVILARPRARYRDPWSRFIISENARWVFIDLARPMGMGKDQES